MLEPNAAPASVELPEILLVSEFPPPAAGMTVAAALLELALQSAGCRVTGLRTNPVLIDSLRWIERIRGIRGLLKWLLFLFGLRRMRGRRIVHIFSSSGLNYYLFSVPVLWLAAFADKAVIINYHGGGAGRFFARRRRLLDWSCARSRALVVPSNFLRDVFRDLGHETRVIGNIANLEQFTFRLRETEPPVLISVRNLTPVYNVACVLRSFARLQAEYPEAVLYVAGDGPERGNLESLCDRLGLKRVHFLGNLDNAVLAEYYAKANLFINTSTVDNMPVSLLEAFACGLPVVSTDVGGIPYLVDDGVTGLLSPSDDDAALAAQLLHLMRDPGLREQMVRDAREAVQAFSHERVSAEWIACYRDALASQDGRDGAIDNHRR